MVFSNLPTNEKEAFFSLLDEYFTSRPDILPPASADGSTGAAASAVHRALASNPAATSQLVSAGLKHGVPKSSPYAAAASNPEITNSVGRLAASFASSQNSDSSANRSPGPPRRIASPEQSEHRPSSVQNLAQARKFGDVDTSSAKNIFGSLRNSTANKSKTPPAVAPPTPPAFPQKKNPFAPPPVRRVSSTSSGRDESPGPPPAPPRTQHVVEEEKEQGEWAEALYDYSSEDPGDLGLQTSQRVLVVERTSDDWWTAELDGKRGLIPASYVKML